MSMCIRVVSPVTATSPAHCNRMTNLLCIYDAIHRGRAITAELADNILNLCASSIAETAPWNRESLKAGMLDGDKSALVAVGMALLLAGAKEG